jgi:TetR/AcrR family transcriptional regulator
MASARRIGAADAKNRAVLLDAAEQLMLDEGYAAVSSRRVAGKAGLKPQLVHYYFRSMDDLFLGVLRRRVEEALESQARVLDSDQPLRALWAFSIEPGAASLTMEFVALANHRKAIRAELAHHAERFRAVEIAALTKVMQRHGISSDKYPPAAIAVLIASLSRVLMLEQAMGVSAGHAELLELIEQHLRAFDDDPASANAARTSP